MTKNVAAAPDCARKFLLATLGVTGAAVPLIIGLVNAPRSHAQTPTPEAKRAEFEVASVKFVDHPVAPHGVGLDIKHGTLTMNAAALRQIVGLAYGIQRTRVQGGPDWADRDLYDIQAKSGNQEATREQIQAMLQALLADRFKLRLHRETRQLPVYTLSMGKNGPKFQEAKTDERARFVPSREPGRIRLAFYKNSVAGLVSTLANVLGSPVLDKTGLEGFYNFTLEYAPDLPLPAGAAALPRPDSVPIDSGPSLFTAVQEQLGLKLEAQKGPVEVIVIDHAGHASEN